MRSEFPVASTGCRPPCRRSFTASIADKLPGLVLSPARWWIGTILKIRFYVDLRGGHGHPLIPVTVNPRVVADNGSRSAANGGLQPLLTGYQEGHRSLHA